MKYSVKCLFILTSFLVVSCSNDSESDLVDTDIPQTTITYTSNIQSILNSNCTGCHSDPTKNGAPFPLTNYDQVLVRMQSGQLLNAISKQAGESRAMPPSGRLPQTTINLVEQWVEDGLEE